MKKTPLFDSHKKEGARFISFSGWQMPFSYQNPAVEHHQVRQTGGIFDVSHMGQIRIKGKDSFSFLEKLLPSNLKTLQQGQALYSVLCSETGGLIDDLILYKYSQENYLLCVNASHKDKDLTWIQSHKKKEQLSIQDESDEWALIAVQGPKSLELCSLVFPTIDFYKIVGFHFIVEEGCLFSRTGYTGEEGFEIYIPWNKAKVIWDQLLKAGKALLISPIGLGARDTLRLEMAYLLSGQDFDEHKSPVQAGLSWLIKSEEPYIGKQAILRQKAKGQYATLKAFVLDEPLGVPRKAACLYSEQGELVGEVTSGAKSPSLNKMIGLAYIKGDHKICDLDIRGTRLKARIVPTPFLKKKGVTVKTF